MHLEKSYRMQKSEHCTSAIGGDIDLTSADI